MRSHANAKFWRLFQARPQAVRAQAFKAYAQFKRDPSHPSLNFELIDRQAGIWSARVNDTYRVMGVRDGSEITWFGSARTASTKSSSAGSELLCLTSPTLRQPTNVQPSAASTQQPPIA